MPGSPSDTILGGAYQQTTGTAPLYWYIENPSTSTMVMYVTNFTFRATGPCRIQAVTGLSSYTGTTSKTPTNTTSTYAPQAILKIGGTPVGGTMEDSEGYADKSSPFTYDVPFIIPPTVHVLFKVTPETYSDVVTTVNFMASWREN